MKKEDKDLLLRDLCARLPYGVKVNTPYNDANLIGIVKSKGFIKDIVYVDVVTDKQTYPIKYIKPYLRPMSSMTEEEKETWRLICSMSGYDMNEVDANAAVDWLNANHFDYRGLIPRGLALPAPKGMYKLKNL